jgi:membrane protease YdiL (CAAX protease family)
MHAWGGIVSTHVIGNLRLMASIAPGSNEAEPTHGATPVVPASTPSSAGSQPPTPGPIRHPTAGHPHPSPEYPASPDSRVNGPREGDTGEGDMEEGGAEEPPPCTSRDAGAWIVFAGLGFIVGQLASSILLVIVAALTGHSSQIAQLASRPVPPAWVEVTGLVGLWFGFVGAVVCASRYRGTGNLVRDVGLKVRPWDVLIGSAVGLAGQLLLLPVLYLPLEHVVPHLDQKLKVPAQHLTGGFPGSDLAIIAFLTVVVVPVVEEMFFRGLVLRSLLRVFKGAGPVLGVGIAVVVDGVVFGLAHFELLELLGLAAFGAVLALMAYKFKRLGPGIFAHGMFNLLAILSVAGILH